MKETDFAHAMNSSTAHIVDHMRYFMHCCCPYVRSVFIYGNLVLQRSAILKQFIIERHCSAHGAGRAGGTQSMPNLITMPSDIAVGQLIKTHRTIASYRLRKFDDTFRKQTQIRHLFVVSLAPTAPINRYACLR